MEVVADCKTLIHWWFIITYNRPLQYNTFQNWMCSLYESRQHLFIFRSCKKVESRKVVLRISCDGGRGHRTVHQNSLKQTKRFASDVLHKPTSSEEPNTKTWITLTVSGHFITLTFVGLLPFIFNLLSRLFYTSRPPTHCIRGSSISSCEPGHHGVQLGKQGM